MPEYIYKKMIFAIIQITSSWKCGDNLEPRVVCSTMKATRSSMAPVETICDESSLMIIENEVEAKRRKKEQEGLKRW